jgi:rhamnosyltransferase
VDADADTTETMTDLASIAVIIPTLNGAPWWDKLVQAIRAQGLASRQVLVVDSQSEDGTVEAARDCGFLIEQIGRTSFNHGGTRQWALQFFPKAQIVVYLTQDAILASENALAILLRAFDDSLVVAAYGRQLPRPGANPIEAHARLFNYPPVSAIRSLENAAVTGFKAIFFSNSFGAYRRTALEQVGGFPRESNFGEDTVVAARLLQSGWRIAYVAEAQVYHSHAYSCREEFRRYYRIGQLHGTEPWLLRDFGKASGEGRRFAVSEIQYLSKRAPWLIPEAVLRLGLKYLGYKSGRRNPQA